MQTHQKIKSKSWATIRLFSKNLYLSPRGDSKHSQYAIKVFLEGNRRTFNTILTSSLSTKKPFLGKNSDTFVKRSCMSIYNRLEMGKPYHLTDKENCQNIWNWKITSIFSYLSLTWFIFRDMEIRLFGPITQFAPTHWVRVW